LKNLLDDQSCIPAYNMPIFISFLVFNPLLSLYNILYHFVVFHKVNNC
jgi:hypothetical protein